MFVYFSLDVIVKEIFLILCIVQTLAAWKKHTWAIHSQFSANKSEKILLHKSMAIGVT